jgi:hypothetical protein
MPVRAPLPLATALRVLGDDEVDIDGLQMQINC